jgi:hypothetical protein
MTAATNPKKIETLYLFVSKQQTEEDREAIRLMEQLPYKWEIVTVDPRERATPTLDAYPLGYRVLHGIQKLRDFFRDQREELGLDGSNRVASHSG